MTTTLRQKLMKLGLAGALTLGCVSAATTTALVSETQEPTPAYADGWIHIWSPETGSWAWFYESGGKWVNGWQYIDGSWYCFATHSVGYMYTGWHYEGNYPNLNWYYLGNDGAMRTGWQRIGGTWYYFSQSGAMQTGWQKIGGKWYYFNSSGAMATGWQYLGEWYYFNSSGAMQTGWQKIRGKWYFLNNSGEMTIGWQRAGGKWFHLNGSGAMDTNKWIGNYYVKSDGSMATNQKIGQYRVGADGLWDGAKKNTDPLHIETDFYVLDLPAHWKNRVSYSTSGNETSVYLTGRKDCTLFRISAYPTGTLIPGGDIGGGNIEVGKTPSGALIIISHANWPFIASQVAMGSSNSYAGQSDKFAELIELQTNGACNLDQILKDPETGSYCLLDHDYIFDEIAPTIKLRN